MSGHPTAFDETLRPIAEPPLLPNKRKLDDNGSLDPDAIANLMRMPMSVDTLPAAAAAAAEVTTKPSSSSSTSLQFFVRINDRSIVFHARTDDTVDSVMAQITARTSIDTSDQRLIYCGRQLTGHRTLAESAVTPDACLHLVARVRSSRFPRSWQILGDINSAVWWLISTTNTTPADGTMRVHMESWVNNLAKEFLSEASMEYIHNGDKAAWGHVQVFLLGGPAALVRLYNSTVSCNRAVASSCIRVFLFSDPEYMPKYIQKLCAPILLELCKMLAGTVGRDDTLYLACRSSLAVLLEAEDSGYGDRLKGAALVVELSPFVSELVRTVIAGLSTEPMTVFAKDLVELSNFLLAMYFGVKDWMVRDGPIPRLMHSGTYLRHTVWIAPLHNLFREFLEKVCQCLGKIGDFLAKKGASPRETRWAEWLHLLAVLTTLSQFSKIFEDGDSLLHQVLLLRRYPLNALVRRARRSKCSLHWLLKYKDVTDFEARRNLVYMMLPEGNDDYNELHEMFIDRSQLLAESFEYIGRVEASELHGGLFIEFKNEEATGPGVLREWFCLLCRAIFNPQNILFLTCPNDRRRFFPNPASVVDPLHLMYFGFCGRVIALALMHKVQVGIVFSRVFFLQLAGRNVSLEDIQDADPCLYMSCKKILDMDAELMDSDVLGLTFIREIEELGNQSSVELCPGGKDIVVNSKNRVEYVNLLIQHRFVTSISKQISHFAEGFGDILTNSKFQKFFFQGLDLEDFDKMLGGSGSVINVREWKANTEYNGYKAKDRQICWFWKIVEGMSAEQKRVLLFFWTSVKYLPVDGFCGLASKLYIYRAPDSNDRLPTSNTCFYRLGLPPYPSVSIMRNRLQLITQEHVSCSFGNW